MSSKKMGRTQQHDPKQNDYADFSSTDLRTGLYSLTKATRINRQQKRAWRRKSGGALRLEVAGWLPVLVVIVVMVTGGAG